MPKSMEDEPSVGFGDTITESKHVTTKFLHVARLDEYQGNPTNHERSGTVVGMFIDDFQWIITQLEFLE